MPVAASNPFVSVYSEQWRFTGLEFQVLWTRLGRDRLPYPLRYRPVARTQDDLERQRRDAAQSLSARSTAALHRHLVALAEPDVRVEVAGFERSGAPTVRVHAGIRGDVGAVAVQWPGPDRGSGGDVLLSGLTPDGVPRAIAATLPAVPPGSRAAVRFRRSDVRPGAGTLLAPADGTRLRDEVTSLLGRPRTGVGEVTAYAGAAWDSRTTDGGLGLHWFDVDGDGRYTVQESGDVTAAPASPAELATRIEALLTAIRVRETGHGRRR